MKERLLIILTSLLLIYTSVLNAHTNNIDTFRLSYLDRVNNPMKFMDFFPASGNQFYYVFGYEEDCVGEVYYSPLYEDACKYVQAYFLLCESLNVNDYYTKIISLSCQLEWQADGVNYFQHELINRMIDKQSLFSSKLLYLLHEQPIDIVMRFWNFCLSGTPDRFPNKAWNDTFLSLSDIVSSDFYLYNALQNIYEQVKMSEGKSMPR